VQAKDASQAQFTVGGGAVGLVGVGGAVAVLNVAHNARTSVAGNLTAGGDVSIAAELDENIVQRTVAAAGGLVGLGASVSFVNDASVVQAALADGGIVGKAASLSVTADADQTLKLQTSGATVGAAAVGPSFAKLTVGKANVNEVAVTIGANARIGQVGGVGDVDVAARSEMTADVDVSALTGGLVAAQANAAIADVRPEVRAAIGDGTLLSSTGDVDVLATADHRVETDVRALTVGGATEGYSRSRATLDPDVIASAGGTLNAGSGIAVRAAYNVDPSTGVALRRADGRLAGAFANADAPVVAASSAARSDVTVSATPDVQALVNANARLTAGSQVAVHADGVNLAQADGNGFMAGLAGVGFLDATATASSSEKALVGNGASINAASLDLQAEGVDRALAHAESTNVAGFSGSGSDVTATVRPTVQAQLGANAKVETTGNTVLRASSLTDADALAQGLNIALAGSFGKVDATATATPTVTAVAGAGSEIKAQDVTIQAVHGAPASLSDGSIASVDTTANSITTAQAHGLATGDRIQYAPGEGHAALGGLVADKSYGVIVIDADTVVLGNPFAAGNVDAKADTIRFASPHGLATGDQIVYDHANGGSGIAGLVKGQSYFVRVIDAYTVKLGTSLAQVTQGLAAFSGAAANAATDAITLANHGFADGQAVTYRGPYAPAFYGSSVDADGDRIYLPAPVNGTALQTGDKITYTTSGTSLGGLGNNGTYYVYRVDADAIKLSTSPIKGDGTDVFVNLSRSAAADTATHTLTRFGEKAIAGLVSGQTYYVKRIDANGFLLSATPGGAAVNITAAGVGAQYIGVEGLDLDATGASGQQWLAADLTGALDGNSQRLVGAGGLVAANNDLGIDGVSRAVAVAPSFALGVAGVGADALVNESPTVSAGLGNGAHISATGNVEIASRNHGTAAAQAGAGAGALVGGFGHSDVKIYLTQSSTANVGTGAQIDAGGSIGVTADNRVVAVGTAYAGGAAAGISSNGADSLVQALPTTTTTIAADARLKAKGDVDLQATMGAEGSSTADSFAYAFLGSGGSANAWWTVGNAGDDNFGGAARETQVNIGAGALVASDKKLNLLAQVDESRVGAAAEASAGSVLYSDPDSKARTFFNSNARVNVAGGAQLKGVDALDVTAAHQNANLNSHAYSDGGSIAGAPESHAWAMQQQASLIQVDDGASLASRAIDVEAIVAGSRPDASSDADGFSALPWEQADHEETELNNRQRVIHYDGDLILLSAPVPRLVVDEAGHIVEAQGVTAHEQAGLIVVDGIDNDGNAGTVRFATNAQPLLPLSNMGRIEGSLGTLISRHSYETVDLINHSSKELQVGDINPVDLSGHAKVTIATERNELGFDIVNEYGPTAINIESGGNVALTGLIDNPIGKTTVTAGGDVRSVSDAQKLRSNTVALDAKGDIGQGQRLDVQLVASAGREAGLTALAGGDLALGLSLLDRGGANPGKLNVGPLQAGGDIDLLLRPTLMQTAVSQVLGSYLVDVTETISGGTAGATTSYVNHYKPDGSGPAFVAPLAIFGTGGTEIDTQTSFALLKADGNIAVKAEPGATRIDVTANTDVTGTGHVDVRTNGSIQLTETAGDLRLGQVQATAARDVTLTAAAGGIVDALNDAAADVIGGKITLTAQDGAIGALLNDVEIDSSGLVRANASKDVYLAETAGALQVDQVAATRGDVRLTTLDSNADGENIEVGSAAQISAVAGAVTLQAGDAISIAGKVQAAGRLTMRADYRNADKGQGGSVLATGQVSASDILLEGDSDDDTLDVSALGIATTAYGYGGKDRIAGGSAADQLYGGDDADDLSGGAGDDLLVAGNGDGDRLAGGDGKDLIYGSDVGADWIDGGSGSDEIHGLGGDDRIDGGAGDDWIDGGAGNDTLYGGLGADTVYGHLGDDTLVGFAADGSDDGAADKLFGEWGNDRITGGAGSDLIDGGWGNDIINAGAGDDVVHAGHGLNTIDAGDGNDQVYGSDDGADQIMGGAGDDRLYGFAGNDVIDGGSGDDVIEGGAGDDTLMGGAGSDVMLGGADDDVLYGHSASGAGDDNAVDYLYGDFGTGGNEAGSGRDKLYGQGGNDLLFGEGGDDFIDGTQGFGQVEASGGSGNVIQFGGNGDDAGFTAPAATAAPTLQAVDYTMVRGAMSGLPDGIVQRGRWADLGQLSQGLSGQPAVAIAPGGAQYIAWTDTRNGGAGIKVAKLDNGNWTDLGSIAGSAADVAIAVDGNGAPVLTWTTQGDVHAARFVAGQGWLDLGNLSGSHQASQPQLVMTGNGPVVAWIDAGAVKVSRYENGHWNALPALASGAEVQSLTLASDGTRVAAAWTETVNGEHRVVVQEYAGNGWTALTGSTGAAGEPSLAYFQGKLYAAWQAKADQGAAITVVAYGNDVARTPLEMGHYGVSGGHELPSNPALSAGGNALRLVWLSTPGGVAVDSRLYALRFDGSTFVEEVPGDASGAGLSLTGGRGTSVAVTTDAGGRTLLAWLDAASGQPETFARTMGQQIARTFVADASAGVTVQSILDANDLGLGDAIIVIGAHGDVNIAADDAGVALYGEAGTLGKVTLAASDVLLQRVRAGAVIVDGHRATVTECTIASLELRSGAGVQVTANRIAGQLVIANGVAGSLVDHNTVAGIKVGAASNLTLSFNTVNATLTGIELTAAASGRIRGNVITGGNTGLDIAAAFTGLIDGNRISGAATGVRYAAAAALSGNLISGNTVGVRTSVAGDQGLGFAAGSGVNQLSGNATGLVLVNASVQRQEVSGSTVAVTGSGLLGGTSLDLAMDIHDNQRGVAAFAGTVQYSRFTANQVAIDATAAMGGLKVQHNVFDRNVQAGLQITGTTDVRIAQNTFYAKTGDNIRIVGGSRNVEIQSNILWAEGGYDIYVANDSQAGFFSDYNNLYKTGAGKLVFWTKDFADVLDWQMDVARYDLHSIGATSVNPDWARPRFVDAASGDFRLTDVVAGLRASSPDIDAGNAWLDLGQSTAYRNLLANAGFEAGLAGWATNGDMAVKNGAGYEGSNYLQGGNAKSADVSQRVDLLAAGYSIAQLDGGALDLIFSARLKTLAESQRDAGHVMVQLLAADGTTVLGQLEVDATKAADRWELVGGRVDVAAGTRFAKIVISADRNTGTANDVQIDGAMVALVADGYIPDLGAYGAGSHEAPDATATKIMLRWPDLYTDWEAHEPQVIRWETVNNRGNSAVRIDLLQDTPDGPKLLKTIAASTADTGEFIWRPGDDSGIAFGTAGLRIQVSLVQQPEVIDRAQETFSVPQDGTQYYVDATTGSNRNTGKSPDAPKANPVNLLRAYELKALDTLHIAAGDYALIDNIAITGTSGALDQSATGALAELGQDEGFTITGPADLSQIARLFPAIAGNRTQALIELSDADFVTVRNLTLQGAKQGLNVHADSEGFQAANITASGHAGDGIVIAGTSKFATYDGLRAFGNGGSGIVISGEFDTLSHANAWSNAKQGIDISVAFTAALDNEAHDNGEWGMRFSAAGAARIQRNSSHDNRYGLSVSNTTTGVQTLVGDTDLAAGNGNRVWANRDAGITASGAMVSGNVVSGSTGNGAWGISASNAVVASNVVFGNDSGVKATGSSSRIASNRVYANAKAGVQTDRAEVAANTIYSNATGLRLDDPSGSTTGGNVHNNLIYANDIGGVEIASANGLEFVNNTIVQLAGNALTILAGKNLHLANNILGSTQGYAISVSATAQTGFTSDYNLFLAGTAKVGLWQGQERRTLADWRGGSFTDANSLVADAGFVDMDGADDVLGYVNAQQNGSDDDFHERSSYGGFAGGSGLAPVVGQADLPVMVAAQALASVEQAVSIDRGRATDAFGNEPATNGGYVNIGSYGNTAQAGRSPAQFITVLSPNGGERIGQNSQVELRWRSTGFAGAVNIEVRGAGQADFTRIASGEANDGSYLWNVDAALFPAGKDYEVRVVSVSTPTVSDTSDARFEVLGQIRTYYVNDNSLAGDEYATAMGNDANDGLTPDKPKASIQAILLTYDLNPGDVILVDTGNYTLGTNIFVVAQDTGVTIQGAETHATVLNRGNKASGTAVFEFQGADDVTLQNLSITGALTGVMIADGVDSDGIAIVDSSVYGNGNAGSSNAIFVGTGNTGFTMTGSEVRSNTGLRGVYVNAADARISANVIKDNSGIGLELHGARQQVLDNTVTGNAGGGITIDNNNASAAADLAKVSGNTVQGNGSGKVGISAAGNVQVSGNTVKAQTGSGGSGLSLSGGALGTANEVTGNAIGIAVSGTGIAQGNHVFANTTGISASGTGGQVLSNLVENNTAGGVAVTTNGASTQIRNNRIVGNGGASVLLDSTTSVNGVRPTVENNAIITSGDAIVVRNASKDVRIANNILDVRGSGYAISVDKTSQDDFSSDYNLFALGANAKLGSWEGKTLATRADWAYELGQDTHGLTGTPGYVNEAAGDLHLRADSVAVDRGDPSSAFGKESTPNGGRIDIGAYGNTAGATPSASTYLQLTGPNGLEKLVVGKAATITWRSAGLAQGTLVTVEVSLDGGQHWTAVATAATNAQGAGQASWTPAQATDGNTALLRVSTADGTADQSDEAFLIANVGKAYYVNDGSTAGDSYTSAVGNNANSGTSADKPMASLAALLRAYQLQPGDIVYVDSGNYQLAGSIVLGTEDSGIEIRGTSATVLNRGNTSTDMAVFEFRGADNVKLTNLGITGGLYGIRIADSVDSDGITVSNSRIYGNGNGGSSTAIFVGIGNEGFTLSGSELRDNAGRGAYVNAGDAKLTANKVFGNGGVGLELHGPRGQVLDNESWNNAGGGGIYVDNIYNLGAADATRVERNTVHDNKGTYGLNVQYNVVAASNVARNNLGTGISAYNGAVASGNEATGNTTGMLASNGGRVENNHVFANATGVAVSGMSLAVGNLIEKNTGVGVDVQTNSLGAQVRNNRIVGNGGAAVRLDHVGTTQGQRTTVESNTIITNADGVVVQGSSVGVLLANNILDVRGSGYAIKVDETSEAGLGSDYNLFALGASAKLASWEGKTLASRADWAYELGQDLHSLTGTPGYVNESAGDLHLRTDSIAVDRGNPASAYAKEPAQGGGRIDLGAYGNTAEATPSASTYLQLTGPNGLEKLVVGQPATITWRSSGLAQGTQVTVSYSLDGGLHWSTLGTGTLDAQGRGQLAWTPQQATPAGNTALMRVSTDTGIVDQSDEAFLVANAGKVYYVNDGSTAGDEYATAAGDNANSGKSADKPMASLAALLRAYDLNAGDIVYVDTGSYALASNVVIGTEDSGVEIRGAAQPGHVTLLNRGNTASGMAVFEFQGADDVTLANLSMTGAINGVRMDASVDSDRITIRDSRIYGMTGYGVTVGTGNDQVAVLGSQVFSNANGVQMLGAANRIENSEVWSNTDRGISVIGAGTTDATASIVRNNRVHDNGNYGIYADGRTQVVGNTVTRHLGSLAAVYLTGANVSASGNYVFGNQLGVSLNTGAQLSGSEVYANTTGVYVDGGIVRGNRIYSNATGVLDYRNALIENNLVYANSNVGIEVTNTQNATTGAIRSNTIYQPVGDGLRIGASATNVQLFDNIVVVNAGYGITVASAASLKSSDYNLFWAPGAKVGLVGGVQRTTLADWQAGGFDAHSKAGDPLFQDVDGADNVLGERGVATGGGSDDNFGLRAGSAAIDMASTANGAALDIEGRARRDDPAAVNGSGGFADAGAYEFQGNSADATAPRVTGVTGLVPGSATIELSFSEALDAVSARSASNYRLVNAGADGLFDTADDVRITLKPVYVAGEGRVVLQLVGGTLADGNSRLAVSGGLLDEAGNKLQGGDWVSNYAVVPPAPAPHVGSFEATDWGFRLRFDTAIDASRLNLYAAGNGAADLTVTGPGGQAVTGSVVLDADGRGFAFVRSGGVLAAGSYTVTLAARADSLLSTAGKPLEVDYVKSFSVAANSAAVLGIGEIARGPGQALANPAAAQVFPLTLDNAAGATQVSFTLRYDPALLNVTGLEGGSLPAGSTVTLDLSAPGQMKVTIAASSPLAAGRIVLGNLTATVPTTASYGAVQLLSFTGMQIDGGTKPVKADAGLHVVAYLGDANGDRGYSTDDSGRIQRVATRADSGFAAWPLLDPLLLGDISGNGLIQANDAAKLNLHMGGTPQKEIPAIPQLNLTAKPSGFAIGEPGSGWLDGWVGEGEGKKANDWSITVPSTKTAPALEG